MQAGVKGYKQWFAGKSNNVTDTLSRDWHRNEEELTFILRSHFPEQMPENFRISNYPTRSTHGWSHCCSSCPWASNYGSFTQQQGSSLGAVAEILWVYWMQRPLLWQVQPNQAKSHVRSIYHGCQRRQVLKRLHWTTGWRNSQRCHLTCGTGLSGIGPTDSH